MPACLPNSLSRPRSARAGPWAWPVLVLVAALGACRPGPSALAADRESTPEANALEVSAPAQRVEQLVDLPVVRAAEPGSLRLDVPGHALARLRGERLDEVTRVRVVTDLGSPVAEIEVRLLPGETPEALSLEVAAAPGADSGSYRFQLNTERGGFYLREELARVIVLESPS